LVQIFIKGLFFKRRTQFLRKYLKQITSYGIHDIFSRILIFESILHWRSSYFRDTLCTNVGKMYSKYLYDSFTFPFYLGGKLFIFSFHRYHFKCFSYRTPSRNCQPKVWNFKMGFHIIFYRLDICKFSNKR